MVSIERGETPRRPRRNPGTSGRAPCVSGVGSMDRSNQARRAGPPDDWWTGQPLPWQPASCRAFPMRQQPEWTAAETGEIRAILSGLPALTGLSEIQALRSELGEVARGRGFVSHAGDCPGPFGAAAVTSARKRHRVLSAMAREFSECTGVPVVTVGRLAGQFGKPRSQEFETVDGGRLRVFRGLIINSSRGSRAGRRPHPPRLLGVYRTAQQVVGELRRVAESSSPRSCGRTTFDVSGWQHSGLWTSHETLVMNYEEPLVRWDALAGQWYLTSTHLPWIGARKNQPEDRHVVSLPGGVQSACLQGGTRSHGGRTRAALRGARPGTGAGAAHAYFTAGCRALAGPVPVAGANHAPGGASGRVEL